MNSLKENKLTIGLRSGKGLSGLPCRDPRWLTKYLRDSHVPLSYLGILPIAFFKAPDLDDVATTT